MCQPILGRDKKEVVANSLNNIGAAHYEWFKKEESQPDKNSHLKSALEYYQKALPIFEEMEDKEGVANELNNLGLVYEQMGEHEKALEYLKKGLSGAKEIDAREWIKLSYEGIAEVYENMENYKDALKYNKLFSGIKDSLLNDESNKQIAEMQTKYETVKKEKEIGLQKTQLETKEVENKKQQYFIFLIAAVAIGLIIVAFVIFRSLRITRKQKSIIEEQKSEVEQQKHVIEEHQKEIIDSITYAKRIQQAILPPAEFIKQYLPESFIYYHPKDIVAGDFYWMEHLDETTYIAAADSTGHGVPGAMVSVVCSNALNRAVKEFGLRDTGKILDKTRELVLETFEKSGDEIKDGMDISLLSINKNENQVFWSGANNQLWYIKKEGTEMLEIKADKQPIGKTDNPKPFTSHSINVQRGDTIYLMTDGYPDQFGGENGKKYKYKQLEEKLVANSSKELEEQKDILIKSFDDWKGNLEQVDDVTLIGIKL
jgi:serine phosphatase RsbU (regulator of sigma subunit)